MLRTLFRLLMGSRRPVVDGELAVPGLQKPVVIRRDGYGVPHIDAENDNDAAYALGFVQAQDRAGQLEVLLRIIRGTMAELVGPAALPVDKLSRRIGFHRSAIQQWAVIDDHVKSFLEAFTNGINAGHEHGLKQWPHEFSLLKSTPTPWCGWDVLGYVKFISFQLPSNWDVELARFLMLREDGPDAVVALDPLSPASAERGRGEGVVQSAIGNLVDDLAPLSPNPLPPKRAGKATDMLMDELKMLNEYAPAGGGSNNWAIAGSRTVSGKPILASDPHLGPSLPNPWYLAHVRTPEWSVAGALFASSPVFPIGHNGFACWGVTAGLTDTTDLFIETLSEDGKRAKEPDGSWRDCAIVQETIRVKGGADVTETIAITPRGPIVTPLIPDEKLAISLKAVWLQPRPLRGFFEAMKAKSFEEFRTPFAAWPILPLNTLYADATGFIGYQLVGDLPIRSGGNGLLPTPVSRGDWSGYVHFDDMPFTSNPSCGFLATANDDPRVWLGEGSAFLGEDFIDPYRAELIREELAIHAKWTVPLVQNLQMNLRSKPWQEIRELVLGLTATGDAAIALDQLRGWDGYVTPDSSAAAVFELFLAGLCVQVAKLKAPKCWKLAVGGDGRGPFANNILGDRRVQHFVNLLQTQPGIWDAAMIEALAGAVAKLREEAGPSPPYWAWGHRRTLTLRHPLLGKHRLFGRIFNLGPVPIGGDANTIAQAGVRPLTPMEETHNFPNMRTSFDTANWSNCRFALAGGQSGNPCSPHFDDQFPLWQRGEGIPMPWTPEEVIAAAKSSLRLKPFSSISFC